MCVCRTCLYKTETNSNDKFINIFNYFSVNLSDIISKYLNINITEADGLPKTICKNCVRILTEFHQFYTKSFESNKILNEKYLGSKQNQENIDILESDVENENYIINSESDCKEEEEPGSNCNEGKQIYEINDSIKEIIGNNVYICDICNEKFPSFAEYFDHQETHDGQPVFKCSKCFEIFTTRKQLVKHDAKHKIPCKICNLEVLPKSMAAHLLIHTDTHKCTYCGASHTSKAILEKHMKARHKGIKGYVCHICGKQNSCQSSMNRHMAYHSQERPYKCKYCDFRAKSSNIVQVHTSRIHFAEKCVCEICAKLFKSQMSLNQHMKRFHTGTKHKCHICGKAFTERYNLSKHMKKHVGQRLHECKVCRTEFFTVRELNKHKFSHREGCVKCPTCFREFFYKKYFDKHIVKCTEKFKIHE